MHVKDINQLRTSLLLTDYDIGKKALGNWFKKKNIIKRGK